MDFFAEQLQVQRRSRWLMALFVGAVLGAVAGVDGVLALLYHAWSHLRWYFGVETTRWPPWPTLAWMTAVQLAGIGVAAGYRITQLRNGGWVIAQDLGGMRVAADTTDPARRRLLNVVEEMAIAANIPVPDTFVMEGEAGINAFTAGYAPADAVVCVTQGCIDRLTRDELQGVVAHEFAHVVNGDIRLGIRMVGLLYGILCINLWGHQLADGSLATRATNEGQQAGYALQLMLGVLAITAGAFGSFWARLAQAAVGRSRERLADASALRLTRNDRGLIGALRKAAATPAGSALIGARRQEIAHMSFAEVDGRWGPFATHPTLQRRLTALGARCDPRGPTRRRVEHASVPASDGAQDDAAEGSAAGSPRPELLWAAYDPHRAGDVLLALVISQEPASRAAQLAMLRSVAGTATEEAVGRLLPMVAAIPPAQRLALAFRTFPALRQAPRNELTRLLDTLTRLARVDRHIDLHEYCLLRALAVQIRDLLTPSASAPAGTLSLRSCRAAFATACAIVARCGSPDNEPAAASAFRRAVQQAIPGWCPEYHASPDWQPVLDRALARLAKLHPADKRKAVLGLAVTITSDGVVTVGEAELLRVICAYLQCPPPTLRGLPRAAA